MSILLSGKNLFRIFSATKNKNLENNANFIILHPPTALGGTIFYPNGQGKYFLIRKMGTGIMYPDRVTIEPTKKTPHIILERGRILFAGRSIPENPADFYSPVHEWISEYISGCTGDTDIILCFEYINTLSIKWVYTILKEIARIIDMPCHANVSWFYEEGDDDMYELGQIIRTLVKCPFRIVIVEDIRNCDFSLFY